MLTKIAPISCLITPPSLLSKHSMVSFQNAQPSQDTANHNVDHQSAELWAECY